MTIFWLIPLAGGHMIRTEYYVITLLIIPTSFPLETTRHYECYVATDAIYSLNRLDASANGIYGL